MDQVLGLLLLAAYITGVVGLAAAITWAVIKIFPTERNPSKPDKPETPTDEGSSSTSSPGSLFRRSKGSPSS